MLSAIGSLSSVTTYTIAFGFAYRIVIFIVNRKSHQNKAPGYDVTDEPKIYKAAYLVIL